MADRRRRRERTAALLTLLGQRIDLLAIHQAFFLFFAVAAGLPVLARLVPAVVLTTERGRRDDAPLRGPGPPIAVLVATLAAGALAAALVLPAAFSWQNERRGFFPGDLPPGAFVPPRLGRRLAGRAAEAAPLTFPGMSDPASSAVPALPTAELHVHIEGTLEPELAFDLAGRNGTRLRHGDLDELRRAYAFDDLRSFLDLYYELTAVLQRPEDFTDLAEAYLVRAAAQGVRHAEVFVDPQAHAGRGVPLEVVMDGLGEAFTRAEGRHGVSARLIACFLRDRDPAEAEDLVPRLAAYPDLVVGVGLDSAETGFPPELFERAFALAAEQGLHRVAHAGEEGPPAYVWSALDRLGVERVDHGNRSLEDPSLVARLREEQLPLTVCPLSNLALRGIDRLEAHPLRRMLDAGLVATVNSDDPAYFGGYLHDNVTAVTRALGLTAEHRRRLAENSFRASFLPDADKERYLAELAAAADPSR